MWVEMLTGPQGTEDQRGDLAETAGLMGLHLIEQLGDLFDAKTLYVLPEWQTCPTALADVEAAQAWGVPVVEVGALQGA